MPKVAKKKYTLLMKKYNGNLGALLEVQRNSAMGYGLEFWDIKTLAKIFRGHPNWARMSQILTDGLEWSLEPPIRSTGARMLTKLSSSETIRVHPFSLNSSINLSRRMSALATAFPYHLARHKISREFSLPQ
jgi:hypothetical protein